jgi:hypothetical protein
MKKHSFLLVGLFAASPSLAANNITIDQVGSAGSVSVEQTGKQNKAIIKMMQVPADAKEDEPKPVKESDVVKVEKDKKKEKLGDDYQATVLSDPYRSQRARAQQLIDKQAGGSTGNRIQIYQKGEENKAEAYQEGQNNELLVNQQGRKNEIKREQKGKHNHYKIIQNSDIVESDEIEK